MTKEKAINEDYSKYLIIYFWTFNKKLKLTLSEALLLSYFYGLDRRNAISDYSIKEFSRYFNFSERNCQYCLKKLKSKGFLYPSIKRVGNYPQGYSLNMDKIQELLGTSNIVIGVKNGEKGKGYFKMPLIAFKMQGLTNLEVLILFFVGSFGDKFFKFSQRAIGERFGVSQKAVFFALKKLRKMGFINRKKRNRSARSDRDIYKVKSTEIQTLLSFIKRTTKPMKQQQPRKAVLIGYNKVIEREARESEWKEEASEKDLELTKAKETSEELSKKFTKDEEDLIKKLL